MIKTFNEVQDVELRTWNRCAVFFNLIKDSGFVAARGYAGGFDDISLEQMKRMLSAIKNEGYEEIKRRVISKGHIIGDC